MTDNNATISGGVGDGSSRGMGEGERRPGSAMPTVILHRIIQVVGRPPAERKEGEVEPLIQPLRRLSPLFKSLDSEGMLKLFMMCDYERVNKDHVTVRQGERGDCSYIQLSGRSSLYIDSAGPNEPSFSISADLLSKNYVDKTNSNENDLQASEDKKKTNSTQKFNFMPSDEEADLQKQLQIQLELQQMQSSNQETCQSDVTCNKGTEQEIKKKTETQVESISETDALIARLNIGLKPAGGKKLDRSKLGTFVKFYDPISSYGELALLSDKCTRTASIVCDETSDLLIIPRHLFNLTLKKREVDEINDRRIFLEKSELFSGWQPRMRRLLEMSLLKEYYPYDTHIVKQGQKITGLHFIIRGEAKITMDPSAHVLQYPKLMDRKTRILHEVLDGKENDEEGSRRKGRREGSQGVRCHSALVERVRIRREEGFVAAEKHQSGRDVTLCTVDQSQIVGATELVCGLDTYMQSVVTTSETVVFRLDTRNIERLVVKPRVTSTILTMFDKVETKLRARLTSKLGSQIELHHHLLAIVMKKRSERLQSMDRSTSRNIFRQFSSPAPRPVQRMDPRIENRRPSMVMERKGQGSNPGKINAWKNNPILLSPASVNLQLRKISSAHDSRKAMIAGFTRTLPRSRRELEKLTRGKTTMDSRIMLKRGTMRAAVNVYLNPVPPEVPLSDQQRKSSPRIRSGEVLQRDGRRLHDEDDLNYDEDEELNGSSAPVIKPNSDKTTRIDVQTALRNAEMCDVINRLGKYREDLFNTRSDVILSVANNRRRFGERKVSINGRLIRQKINPESPMRSMSTCSAVMDSEGRYRSPYDPSGRLQYSQEIFGDRVSNDMIGIDSSLNNNQSSGLESGSRVRRSVRIQGYPVSRIEGGVEGEAVFDRDTSDEVLSGLERGLKRFYERAVRLEGGPTATRSSNTLVHPMKRFEIKSTNDVPFPAGTVLVRCRPSTAPAHQTKILTNNKSPPTFTSAGQGEGSDKISQIRAALSDTINGELINKDRELPKNLDEMNYTFNAEEVRDEINAMLNTEGVIQGAEKVEDTAEVGQQVQDSINQSGTRIRRQGVVSATEPNSDRYRRRIGVGNELNTLNQGASSASQATPDNEEPVMIIRRYMVPRSAYTLLCEREERIENEERQRRRSYTRLSSAISHKPTAVHS